MTYARSLHGKHLDTYGPQHTGHPPDCFAPHTGIVFTQGWGLVGLIPSSDDAEHVVQVVRPIWLAIWSAYR